MRSGRYRLFHGFDPRVRALWYAIGVLGAVGLGAAIYAWASGTLGPEIIVETCSLMCALLLVLAQRWAVDQALRRRALKNIAEELLLNARDLCGGELMRGCADILDAKNDPKDGLRYFYPHMATTVTGAALMSGALDGYRDQELAKHLSDWTHTAEECNRRFAMAEHLLFSTSADEAGVAERIRVHVSIVTGPAAKQRKLLRTIVDRLSELREDGALPKRLTEQLDELVAAVTRFDCAEAIVRDIERL